MNKENGIWSLIWLGDVLKVDTVKPKELNAFFTQQGLPGLQTWDSWGAEMTMSA